SLAQLEGTWDPDKRIMTFVGEMKTADGRTVRWREETQHTDERTQVYRSIVLMPDGKEHVALEVTYRRRWGGRGRGRGRGRPRHHTRRRGCPRRGWHLEARRSHQTHAPRFAAVSRPRLQPKDRLARAKRRLVLVKRRVVAIPRRVAVRKRRF